MTDIKPYLPQGGQTFEDRPYSFSQLSTYAGCGRKYKFKYVDKIDRQQKSLALGFGSSLHEAIEKFHLSYSTQELTKEEMLNAFELAFNEEMKELTNVDQEDVDNNYEMGLDACLQYWEKFHGRGKPLIALGEDGTEIPCVEMNFIIPVNYEGKEIGKIKGIIDLIIRTEDGIVVVDHKTSKTDYSEFQVKTSMQLALYSYVFREMIKQGRFPQLTQKTEDLVVFNVFKKQPKNTKRKFNGVEMSHFKAHVSDGDIEVMMQSVHMFDKGVRNGVFVPNFNTLCKSCEYNDICENYKGSL